MCPIGKYAKKIAACILALVFFYPAAPVLAEKLTIDVAEVHNTLHIKANLDRQTRSYEIAAQEMIAQKLKTIYYLLQPTEKDTGTLENTNRFLKHQFSALQSFLKKADDSHQNQLNMPKETRALLEEVGGSIFNPIHSYMDAATEVEFVVAENEMEFPLDALFYQGRPLFLLKPVTYKIGKRTDGHFAVSKTWSGCMISDPTSAAGKAVKQVKQYFPNSRYFNSQTICFDDIKKLGAAEILIISAAGGPEGIELPHLAIRSWTLAALKPSLTYFNTAKLGLSLDFLKSFQQVGTHYYVAPIFDYKSDDASAVTVERFFCALSRGNSPSYALYLTRKTIFDECLQNDKDFKWLMLQAFPFRVYQLN